VTQPTIWGVAAWGVLPWGGVPVARQWPTDDPTVLLRGQARGILAGHVRPPLGTPPGLAALTAPAGVGTLAVRDLPALTVREPIRLRATGDSGALRAQGPSGTLRAPGAAETLTTPAESDLAARDDGRVLRGKRGD
jgi:hypothetical protein